MVRTLDSALTTALNTVTRRPALTLTIEDHVIHYAAYQNPGTGDALHADSAAPTGSGRSAFCRIIRLLAHYDAQHCLDDLQLSLEGV